MCEMCNGTGGINLEYGWGLISAPCPNSDCDYDREKAMQEMDETIKKMRNEIYSRRKLNA